VPIFIYVFFSPMKNNIAISFAIVLLAGFTDVLDGYIARKYNLVTKIGIVLDPFADKLMLLTVLVSMTIKGMLPLWIIVVVALKESVLLIGALILHKNHEIVVPANFYGKAATASFYIAIISVAFGTNLYLFFMILFVVLTMLALIIYANNFRKLRNEIKSGSGNISSVENGVYKGDK